MLLVGEHARRTAGLEDVTGGFILPVHRGEKKSQEGRDVVVWRSPMRPGVVIIGRRPVYSPLLQKLGRSAVWEGAHPCGFQARRYLLWFYGDPCPLP